MKNTTVLKKFLKNFGVNGKNTIFNLQPNLNNGLDCHQHQLLSNLVLHHSIIQGDLNQTILYLEEQNETNIDQKDIHGYTPLIYAIKYEHTEIVNYLLFKGVSVYLESSADGLSPLEYAVSTGNRSIIKALETWGAK